MGNSNPADWIFGAIIAFILLVVGFFLFPGANSQATSVNTTGWLPLTAGVHSLTPYALLGAILLGVFWAFTRRHS